MLGKRIFSSIKGKKKGRMKFAWADYGLLPPAQELGGFA